MTSFNIAQLAYMWAKKEKCERCYFAGNFVRNHEETMDNINFAFTYY